MKWGYSSTNSKPQQWLGASGEPHAPAALPPRKGAGIRALGRPSRSQSLTD